MTNWLKNVLCSQVSSLFGQSGCLLMWVLASRLVRFSSTMESATSEEWYLSQISWYVIQRLAPIFVNSVVCFNWITRALDDQHSLDWSHSSQSLLISSKPRPSKRFPIESKLFSRHDSLHHLSYSWYMTHLISLASHPVCPKVSKACPPNDK